MALTTDFSGTYDYEKEEARAIAETMLEDFNSGYYSPEQYELAVAKELRHWEKVLMEPALITDFRDEFNRLTVPYTGVPM